MRRLIAAWIAAVTSLATSSTASADNERIGGLGFSLGFGQMSHACDGCGHSWPFSTTLAVNGAVYLRPHVAVVAEVNGNFKQYAWSEGYGIGIGEYTGTFGAQWWLTRRFWVRGQLGYAYTAPMATNSVDDPIELGRAEPGLAFVSATGFEFVSTKTLAIEFEGRIVNALYEQRGFTSAATLGVGCNYYF